MSTNDTYLGDAGENHEIADFDGGNDVFIGFGGNDSFVVVAVMTLSLVGQAMTV